MAFALRQRSPQLLTVPFAPDNPPARIEEFPQDGRTKPMGSPTQNARGARTVCNSRYVDRERAAQLEVLRRRRASYTPGREPVSAAGRLVIVVDVPSGDAD